MPSGDRTGRDSADYLRGVVERWQRGRVSEARKFSMRGFRNFAEYMNAQTREVVAYFGTDDPDFYSALAELAVNAQTLTTPSARLLADGRDVTKL